MKLTAIDGVGDAKADLLEDEGWSTVQHVAAANLSQITRLDGVGSEVVVSAQDLLGWGSDLVERPNGTIPCTYCDYSAPSLQLADFHIQEQCRENPDANNPYSNE